MIEEIKKPEFISSVGMIDPSIKEFDAPQETANVTAEYAPKQAEMKEARNKDLPVQPAIFKKESTFGFLTEELPSYVDVFSLKQDERNFDIQLAKYNRGVIDDLPAIEDVKGAVEYIDTNKFGYKALAGNQGLINYYENKGKIGFGETWSKMNKWGILPYIGDVTEIVDDISIFSLIKKANAGEQLQPDEESKLQEFAQDMIEIDIRGHTWQGKMLEGIYKMPAFAIEFMTGGAIIKQAFKQGSMRTAKVLAKKGLHKYVKSKIARGAAKMVTEGAIRTVINPVSVTKSYMNRKINDSVTVTDKGKIFLQESEESPAKTLVKALGDVFVEQTSETAGSYLFKPIGRKLPLGIRKLFDKLSREKVGVSAKAGMRKLGWDGLLEEIGEERLGDMLRVGLNLDAEEGYSVEQFGNAMFPDFEDLMVEAGVIAFHGTFSRAGAGLMNRLAGKQKIKSPEELKQLQEQIDSLSESQKESIIDELNSKETAEEINSLNESLDVWVNQAVAAGRSKEEVSKIRPLYEGFIAVSADYLGKKRSDVAKDFLPSIAKIEPTQGRKGFYDAEKNIIGIVESANRSTLIHESAHSFFQFYLKNMPSQLNTVFDWVGMKAPENTNDLEPAEYVRAQEAFARGFETYLAEGKAPNEKLATVFETFKNWLLDVYNYVGNIMVEGGFDFKLSDDVRNFFGEMINAEVEREIMIDKDMKPTIEGRLPIAYQSIKERISKLRTERNRIIKQSGIKKKADFAEVDALIKEFESMAVTIKPSEMAKVAKEEFSQLPISEVFERKMRVTPAFKELVDSYEIPNYLRTTDKNAATVEELSQEIGMEPEAMLEKVFSVKSKKQFIEESIDRQKKEVEEHLNIEDVEQTFAKTLIKLKADAKAQSITQLQKEVITRIRTMDAPRKDKVRFLGRIQQAKTPYSQKKVMFDLLDQERFYFEKEQRNIIDTQIQKLLKQTKPKREGGVTKGKYIYEDNEMFQEIVRINKLNQEQALKEVDLYSKLDTDEVINEKEALVRQFTMYKAYGKSKSSLELFEVLYKNLQRAIELAKTAKGEQDFNDRMNKKRKIIEVLEGIDSRKFKGDAKSIMTKVLNAYRLGFTNIYSMINSIAGKEVAEELNPERQENRRNTATHNQIKSAVQGAMQIYDLKNPHDFIKMMDKYTGEEYSLVEQIDRGYGRFNKHTFDRMGLLDIYNAIKNEKTRTDYFRSYGEANVMEMVSKLSDAEIQFADLMMAEVQSYREAVNKKHIEQTGVDMGNVPDYWMATSQKPKDTLLDNMRMQGSLPSFVKARAAGGVVPIPRNAWTKYSQHIAAAEHMIILQDSWRELRQIFDSETVKSEITAKYGDKVNKVIQKQIDGISLNQLSVDIDEVSGFFGKVLGNWIKAKISLNVSVFSKQLISIGNYIEDMPVLEWNKYFLEGMASPIKTRAWMWKNAPFLEARFHRGYSEDIERAQMEAKRLAGTKKFTDWMTLMVRMGDIGAITYGGYPVVKYLTEKKGMSMEAAVAEFEKRTLRAQQSGLSSSLSPVQMTKNPFVNFFFAFKNTPTQYMRKMADAIISFRNEDISAGKFTKIMLIYGAIQPALFGGATQLMRSLLYDDDDDYVDDIISNVWTAPTNAIPLIGDINKYAVNALIANATGDRRPYSVFSTPMLGDIESWVASIEKGANKGLDDLNIFEFIDLVALPLELGVGAPIQTLVRPFEKRMKQKKKTKL